jgi:2-methylcitrate dehydratase PrpD
MAKEIFMTLAQQLAERIVAMRADNLPKAALDWSKIGVMDTLGCTLAGVAEEAPSKVADVIGVQVNGAGSGESLVLGTASRTSALDAALINGVAAHVLDYDNGGANMGGHASAVMVPALLAAAEAFDCSGVDVLVAHAAGFETGSQLGRAVHPEHYDFNLFNGPGKFHAERVLDTWGAPLDIIEPGAAYKLYPCCYSTHAAVEGALNLVREHGPFKADDIARIDSYTAAQRLPHTDRPQPKTALEAKFSVQYCVARAVLDGHVLMRDFDPQSFQQPAMQSLLARVHATPHLEGQFEPGQLMAAEVKITFKDGRSVASRVLRPLGRTTENPIPPALLKAKFADCAASVLPVSQVAKLSQALDHFETVTSVRDFMRLLEVPAVPQTQRKIA